MFIHLLLSDGAFAGEVRQMPEHLRDEYVGGVVYVIQRIRKSRPKIDLMAKTPQRYRYAETDAEGRLVMKLVTDDP